jgi:hypothetical protein
MIARGIGARAGELKTGLKTQKNEVQQDLGPINPNRVYAQSSDIAFLGVS